MLVLHADLTIKLAEQSNSHLLDGGIPALTSSAIMSRIFRELFNLRKKIEVLDDSSSTVNEGKAPMSAIRAISTYEYASMFGFHADLTIKLAELSNSHLLDGGIPALKSSAIMSHIFRELFNLRQENFEVLDDSSSTVNETVFSYFGGAIGARLPDKNSWMHAYEGDPITVALKALASTQSPSGNF